VDGAFLQWRIVFFSTLGLSLLLSGVTQGAAPATPSTDLSAKATQTLKAMRQSDNLEAQAYGCSSASVPEGDCAERLKKIAASQSAPMAVRLQAAAGLILTKHVDEPVMFDQLAQIAREPDLHQMIETISALPDRHAVPPLARLLKSGSDTAKVAAARALAKYPTTDSTAALEAVSGSIQPGTALWSAVTATRVKLGQPDALAQIGAVYRYMEPADLVTACEGLLASNDPRAEPLLMDAVRNGAGIGQLRAAVLVRDRMPERLPAILAAAMSSTTPQLRLEALKAMAQLDQPLPASASNLLRDPDPGVRAAAADTILTISRRR
jgi:HEAT repeat protein